MTGRLSFDRSWVWTILIVLALTGGTAALKRRNAKGKMAVEECPKPRKLGPFLCGTLVGRIGCFLKVNMNIGVNDDNCTMADELKVRAIAETESEGGEGYEILDPRHENATVEQRRELQDAIQFLHDVTPRQEEPFREMQMRLRSVPIDKLVKIAKIYTHGYGQVADRPRQPEDDLVEVCSCSTDSCNDVKETPTKPVVTKSKASNLKSWNHVAYILLLLNLWFLVSDKNYELRLTIKI